MPRLRLFTVLLVLPTLLVMLPALGVVRAQQGSGIPLGGTPASVITPAEINCAGFISTREIKPNHLIVGGEKEDEKAWFTTSDVVYVDYGAKHGASVGETLVVLRPHGKYEIGRASCRERVCSSV